LKHFGRLLGIICLFPTPSKTDGRVPSQQGASTTCNLTHWEVSLQTYVQTLNASLGVVVIGQNLDLQLGGREGRYNGCGLRGNITPPVRGGGCF